MSSHISPFVEHLEERLNQIYPCAYQRLESIETFPLSAGKRSLAFLVAQACQCQHVGNITVAREAVKRVPSVWLSQHLPEVVRSSISLDDEWEYRRLLELLREVAPHLLVGYIEKGRESSNEEVREAAEDFIEDG
jgi:hypothetical protein